MNRIINIFQMDHPKGTLFHTTSSIGDPMKPDKSWHGSCVAVFRCRIKNGVQLRQEGLVRYIPKNKR